MECESVRQALSDHDGRSLRARKLKAHLEDCDGCRGFAASIDQRRADLAMLCPPLPALAATGILGGLLGVGAKGSAAAAGAAGAGSAGAGLVGGGLAGSAAIKGASLAAAVVVAAGAADMGGAIDLPNPFNGGGDSPPETAAPGRRDRDAPRSSRTRSRPASGPSVRRAGPPPGPMVPARGRTRARAATHPAGTAAPPASRAARRASRERRRPSRETTPRSGGRHPRRQRRGPGRRRRPRPARRRIGRPSNAAAPRPARPPRAPAAQLLRRGDRGAVTPPDAGSGSGRAARPGGPRPGGRSRRRSFRQVAPDKNGAPPLCLQLNSKPHSMRHQEVNHVEENDP